MTKRISFSPTESLESFIIRYQARHNLGRPQEVIRDALLLLEEEEHIEAYNQFARNETLSSTLHEICRGELG
jgi:PhoPQ-activated pathogenicity-related protein